MNLYLLTQDEVKAETVYYSVVVAAEDAETAQRISPDENIEFDENGRVSIFHFTTCWVHDCRNVTVTLLGAAAPGIEQGVINASFDYKMPFPEAPDGLPLTA